MEATVAERGQITLPKAAPDKLGPKLEVEIKNGQLLLRKRVSPQLSKSNVQASSAKMDNQLTK